MYESNALLQESLPGVAGKDNVYKSSVSKGIV